MKKNVMRSVLAILVVLAMTICGMNIVLAGAEGTDLPETEEAEVFTEETGDGEAAVSPEEPEAEEEPADEEPVREYFVMYVTEDAPPNSKS